MKNISKSIKFFIPLFIAISGLSALIYVSTQQVYRQSANSEQIQLAEDIARSISAGTTSPSGFTYGNIEDMAKSLQTFIIIYGKNGEVLSSTAQLNNKTPTLPMGVFDSVNKSGEDRITWQPDPNVRIAAVIVKTDNGSYVLAGKNLREVERNEDNLTKIIFLGWAATISATFIATLLFV